MPVFLNQCAATHKCAVDFFLGVPTKSLINVQESMQKQPYVLHFTPRCAANCVFKISVPQTQKGWEPLIYAIKCLFLFSPLQIWKECKIFFKSSLNSELRNTVNFCIYLSHMLEAQLIIIACNLSHSDFICVLK
jgi:hypothetical protein